jgi:predicted phosphoribosyltransferase
MFDNREDAGRQLAQRLKTFHLRDPLVLAIPRGGVVTGAIVARQLGAQLDVVLARKLRAPFEPNVTIGAVGEDGAVFLSKCAELAGVERPYIESERAHQLREIAQWHELFRSVRQQEPMAGRSVILTDDGVATGSSIISALHVVQVHQPRELIVAVPVAPQGPLKAIAELCDRVICLLSPDEFCAIGEFYRTLDPVADQQVMRILRDFETQKRDAEIAANRSSMNPTDACTH